MVTKSSENALPVIIEDRPTLNGRVWKQHVNVRVGQRPVQTLVLQGSTAGEIKDKRKAVFIVAVADDMIGRLSRFSHTYNDARPLIRRWRKDKSEAEMFLKENGVNLKTRVK